MSKRDWKHLDMQIHQYSSFLRDELGLEAAQSNNFATTISQEIAGLSFDVKETVKSSAVIPIKDRLDELVAFQSWMDVTLQIRHPSIVRAQVITQNYISFVYLGESCFNILRKHSPSGSTTRKACQFLTDNPVRAFRNAIAHANWKYKADYSGIEFWARKGSEANEPMVKWEVGQTELSFWQALARAVAYVTFTSLSES